MTHEVVGVDALNPLTNLFNIPSDSIKYMSSPPHSECGVGVLNTLSKPNSIISLLLEAEKAD